VKFSELKCTVKQ